MSALLIMKHAGKKSSSNWNTLANPSEKWPKSFLLLLLRRFNSSIAALAQEAGVSEPTVNRFCRSLETRGFPDFKLHTCTKSGKQARLMLIAMWMKDDSVDAYTAKNI